MTHGNPTLTAFEAAATDFLLAGFNPDDLKRVATTADLSFALSPGEVAREAHKLAVLDASVSHDTSNRWLGRRAWRALFDDGSDNNGYITVLSSPVAAAGIEMRLRGDGDWLVTGEVPLPLADRPDRVILLARTSDDEDIVALGLDFANPGIRFSAAPHPFGAARLRRGKAVLTDHRVQAARAQRLDDAKAGNLAKDYHRHLRLFGLARDLGALHAAVWEARDHVINRSARWYDAWPGPVREDPLVLREFGRWWVKLRAADELFSSVAAGLDNDEVLASRELQLARSENFTRRLARRMFSEIFELTGASAMRRDRDLDRHWRTWSVYSIARNEAEQAAWQP